jgi:DNA-binding FrmR family transcriptional regulator
MPEKIIKHPNHGAELSRLNRAIGQLDGIKKMITDERYCVDILMQLKAARSAVKNIEMSVLERHMQMCLTKATSSGDELEVKTKIDELIKLVKNFG